MTSPIDKTTQSADSHWAFARSHPVITFLLLTYAWSWLFWLAVIPLAGEDPTLTMAFSFVGGYGPALGGVLTLHLQSGASFRVGRARMGVLMGGVAVLFAVLGLRVLAGDIPGYDRLPATPSITASTLAMALFACLVGAYVISSARSQIPNLRSRMGSLLPTEISWPWLGVALFFWAALGLLSSGIGALLGLDVSDPELLEHGPSKAGGLFLVIFAMTALLRGGMEEPGWRGVMLPALQKRFSPLVASLIIALFWDAWHIPLHLNGFYSSGVIEGMIGRSVIIIPLSVFFTWVYNRSGGLLYVLVLLHAAYNVASFLVPASVWPLGIIGVAIVGYVVVRDKMYEKN